MNCAVDEVGRPAVFDVDPAALHAKVCNQSRSSGALEGESRGFKCEHRRSACKKQRKVSDFNGALAKEGSKTRARTSEAKLPNMLHASKLADP